MRGCALWRKARVDSKRVAFQTEAGEAEYYRLPQTPQSGDPYTRRHCSGPVQGPPPRPGVENEARFRFRPSASPVLLPVARAGTGSSLEEAGFELTVPSPRRKAVMGRRGIAPPIFARGVDSAIRALRPRAAPPQPVERWEIRGVFASLCDGAGAQSLFALAKRGRRFALTSLLVKWEIGVADAWVRDGMTKAEADALITKIVSGAEAVEVSISLLEQRLADALVINVARDVPPPFGLLQVVERLGLGPLHPESISPLELVEALIADLPSARTDTVAARAAHRASVAWEQEFETLASWFEAGEAVQKLLQPLRTRKRRIEAVSAQLLPTRRKFWAERCVWMAATLKEGAVEGDDTWCDFALVARDLVGQRPLAEIPLAARIAAATVEAFEQR
jgi:hypothetical protein